MKPYYEHGGITIYHGDCVEVLPRIEHADMVWTDPPYAEEFLSLYSNLAEQSVRLLPNTGSCFAYCGGSFLPQVIERMGKHLLYNWIISCEHRGPKTNVWPRGVRAGWKPILWYRKAPLIVPDVQITDRVHSRRDKADHEWAQGEEGALIMQACAPDGGLILDPFMGTGTTLRVAKSANRRGIGIEIEERYCEIAAKRLSQEVFNFAEVAP